MTDQDSFARLRKAPQPSFAHCHPRRTPRCTIWIRCWMQQILVCAAGTVLRGPGHNLVCSNGIRPECVIVERKQRDDIERWVASRPEDVRILRRQHAKAAS